MATIHKAGNTAYVSLRDYKDGYTATLVVRNVKTDAQLIKAIAAWRKDNPDFAGVEVESVTCFLYEILKQYVDSVFEINAGVKAKAATATA